MYLSDTDWKERGIEGLRTDLLLIPGTRAVVLQVLAVALVFFSGVLIFWLRRKSLLRERIQR